MKKLSNYRISLRINHPEISPSEITQQLKIEPNRCWKQGDPRKTPKGKILEGHYDKSYWFYRYSIPEEISPTCFFESCVQQLKPHRDFFWKIADDGGSTEFYYTINGSINSGGVFKWWLLEEIAKLYIDLSIEVFPEMNE